jgi:hypothetical protein
MPRVCSICRSSDREGIERAIVAGEPLRDIAGRFRVSRSALGRHQADHLPAHLIRAEQAQEVASATRVLAQLQRCLERVSLLYDATDRYLRDPDDPTRYDVGPRAGDVTVVYEEPGDDDRPRLRRERLSVLLARLAAKDTGLGLAVVATEIKHADPRELHLKAAGRLRDQLELLAKLVGELDDRPSINVLVAPEWLAVRAALLAALAPFPEARAAAAAALRSASGSEARRAG